MRTFIFLLCFSVFSATPNTILSQNAKIKIDKSQEVTVDEVFDLIMSQTDYTFIYQVNMFKNFPKVLLKKGIINANTLLEQSLSSGKFKIDISKNNTVIIKQVKVVQQEKTVTGIVTDKNGVPLPGALVAIGNEDEKSLFRTGVATDFDGSYKLTYKSGSNDNPFIFVRMYGFKNIKEQLNGRTVANFTLEEEISNLEEVIVVGYGTTKKKDLTGSVGSVDSKDIAQIQTQSVEQTLIGKISGVLVGASGGGLGDEGFVHIRGLSQLGGDNQPLYVVDGIPITINPQIAGNDFGTNAPRENPLLAINPSNIERIDVLKDASSAAIYGSRAANGVILITTKKGRLNEKARITYSVNSTIQNPTELREAQNASQFRTRIIENTNAAVALDPSLASDEPINTILNNPDNYFGTEDTDWQSLLRNKDAFWIQHNIGISGGSKTTNYLFSASTSNQEGVIIGHKLKRYSLNSNIDTQINNKIKVGVNISYNNTRNERNAISSLTRGITYRPDLGVLDDIGNPTGNFRVVGGSFDTSTFFLNPLYDEAKNVITARSQNLLASAYGEYEIIEGLKFKSVISIGVNNDKTSNFQPSFTRAAIRYAEGEGQTDQSANLSINRTDSWNSVFTNTLSYNKTFAKKHTLDVVAGLSWDQSNLDLEFQRYYGFPDDDILTDIKSAGDVLDLNSNNIQNALNSIFGRVNYNYDDKYLLTFTARRDGSIKFGENNQYGFFPSAAVAWNVHNEKFLKNNRVISQLKLRASLGRTGADNLPAFAFASYLNPLTFGGSDYAGVNGIAPLALPAPDIRWEETDQLDLGIEFGLFKNRLNAEVIYFEKLTSDLIVLGQSTPETGFSTVNTNIADVSNKGWEITIGGDIIQSKDFRWNSSFNISFIKNNVDALNDGLSPGIIEGYPIGSIRGLNVIGIAETQQQIDDLNANAPNGVYDTRLNQIGDFIFEDVDGSGDIGVGIEQDRKVIGDINPDYFGGWNNEFSFKNWNASFNFQYVQGNERYWQEPLQYDITGRSFQTNSPVFLDNLFWTPENTNAAYARFRNRENGSQIPAISSAIVDGSYIRLRSASIGYSFNETLINRLGLSNLSLTLTGNNLFTITDYPGLDPESVNRSNFTTGLTDDRGNSYPILRTFTLGLNVSF
ncbi:TonB-dependent receptor [Flavivirga abyssicola]|uniref:SusC/RagA family TonB-linked outer membrane protein n=1 Tax=Flavivirga abyssicola TaxID=3063533 RepID=UPI0026DF6027|nr:TonB-dependent receptor [Flavivirga sp. MEBiC07777]WVK12009.1 TonB-dependent receptor [Flavivirga sp. MEBiC07777]